MTRVERSVYEGVFVLNQLRVAVALTSTIALLAPVSPAAGSAFPGDNGKIVYIAGDDIFTVDPDGSNVANLTNTPGLSAEYVSASADGKRIAFNVSSPDVLDDAGLYVINMDGTGARDVLADRHDEFVAVEAPAWSPDGSRLAFEGFYRPSFTEELFVVDADGTDLRRLTNCNCVSSSYPVWSPTGSEIAFVPCCDRVITTINANTGATAEVFVPEPGRFVENLTWSPDGTQIAFDDLSEVYRVSIPGGTPVALTSTGPGFYNNPSWSPDGTKILVESNHESPQGSNRDIYAIDAVNGIAGGITRITTSLDAEHQPEWAPLCETRCTPTQITLRVTKTRTSIRVDGQIQPAVPGGSATVTLFRRTASGFRRVRSQTAAFDPEGLFRKSFSRPEGGKCKVEARFAGNDEFEGTVARKTFAC